MSKEEFQEYKKHIQNLANDVMLKNHLTEPDILKNEKAKKQLNFRTKIEPHTKQNAGNQYKYWLPALISSIRTRRVLRYY